MESGSAFNYYRYPDSNNIAKDVESFATWWTPGQYIIPGLLSRILNVNLGLSISITIIVSSIMGLWGLYKLYRLLKFNELISIGSVLILATQQYYSLPFSIYNGGEVLLFGGMPWIIQFSLRYKEMRLPYSILFILLCLIGFIFKSSFLICLLAIFLTLVLLRIQETFEISKFSFADVKTVFTRKNITYVLKLSAIFLIVFFIIYTTFLSKGKTPMISARDNTETLMNVFFPIAAPFTSVFSIDRFLVRLFGFPGYKYTFKINYLLFYIPISLLYLYLMLRIFFKVKLNNCYKTLLFSFTCVYIIFFIVNYFRKAAISYESRHLLISGLIFLPGLLSYVYKKNTRKLTKGFFTIFIILTCIYGTVSFAVRKIGIKENCTLGKDGFNHCIIDKKTLKILQRLDSSLKEGNNIFYIISPEIALEIKENRFLIFDPYSDFSSKSYLGNVDNLILFLPKNFEGNGKEKLITESFKDYEGFKVIGETDGFKVLLGLKPTAIMK
jgi:hypothetical protein